MAGEDNSFYYIRIFQPDTMYLLILCFVFVLNTCDSALLSPSQRCSVNDWDCQKKFFQSFGSNGSIKGIPALGVPVLDPYDLRDVTVSFRDVIKVTLVDGEALGIADCISTKYEMNINTKEITSNFECGSIIIKGNYKLTAGSFLKLTIGDIINSEGYIVATFEQWNMNTTYPFEVEKHEDGDIYVHCLFNEAKYDQSFGNINVHVENITSGSELTSKAAVDFTNANWKTLVNSFGRYFGDKSLEFYYETHSKFFDQVPVRLYITDDLSPYVDNDDGDNDESENDDEEDEEDEE